MIPHGTGKHKHPRAKTAFRVAALLLLAFSWSAGCKKITHQNEVFIDLVEEWQGGPLPSYTPLTSAEIKTIIGQAVEQQLADNGLAIVAVVDREGFVLAVFSMSGPPFGPSFPVPATSPPDGAPGINEAIAKARTAAFLSSNQNAFTSRTAGYIVDAHFPPGILYTPAGPLFGVQNSSDTGSDVIRGVGAGGAPISNNPTPLPDPNGLSGKPGALPLYKGGWLVGAVGVSSVDAEEDEKSAVAGTRGFMAPRAIRADQILLDGIRLAFVTAQPPFVTASLSFTSLPGSLRDRVTLAILFPGSITGGGPAPAIPLVTLGGVTGQLVFPIVPGGALSAGDVSTILSQAAELMNRLRAGIRMPLGSRAQTTIAVVDTAGNILGVFRPADNTRFSLDIAVQKARTAVVYSDGTATAALGEPIAGLPPGTAVTTRAVGFMAQPFYPPGIDGTPPGPLFGVQDALPGGLGAGIPGLDLTPGVTGDATDGDGITIFPGGIPLYKGGVLVGAIGVSGDGVDQDDMVAAAGATGFEPPAALRCDNFTVRGVQLPYVKFPRNPFDGVR
jgi:uncharacterized protein GlcG (DUF336 family)